MPACYTIPFKIYIIHTFDSGKTYYNPFADLNMSTYGFCQKKSGSGSDYSDERHLNGAL